MADLNLPTIQPGYEYKFNNRIGAEMSVGIPLKFINRNGHLTDTTFYNFYKLRAGLNYYFLKNSGCIELEGFFSHVHFSDYNYNYQLGKNGAGYFSDFVIGKKNVGGIDIKLKKTFAMGKKFYMEGFFGLGVRLVNISLPVNVNPTPYEPSLRFGVYNVDGAKTTPHITMGLQFIYNL